MNITTPTTQAQHRGLGTNSEALHQRQAEKGRSTARSKGTLGLGFHLGRGLKMSLVSLASLGLSVSLGVSFGPMMPSTFANTPATPSPAKSPVQQAPVTRIAFGSCLHQDRDLEILSALAKSKPDALILAGDNGYADTEDMSKMRRVFAKLTESAPYQELRKAVNPIWATWDDHDYGKNDGGAEFSKKREAKAVFLDAFGEPKDSPRRKQDGLFASKLYHSHGRVIQVILLDTRSFRGPLQKKPVGRGYVPSTAKKQVLLGEQQWRQLEQALAEPADLRLLVSSIQVVSEQHQWEKWANLPTEHNRLYELLTRLGSRNLLIISGDRHHHELSLKKLPNGYPLYDVTSSGMNLKVYPPNREPNRYRLGESLVKGYGQLTITWPKEAPRPAASTGKKGEQTTSPRIQIEFMNERAKPVFKHVIAQGQLSQIQ